MPRRATCRSPLRRKDEMRFADAELAARLERGVVADMTLFVEGARAAFPQDRPEVLAIAGGVALFVGAGSPVNEAYAIGMSGPVTAQDVATLTAFYRERGDRGSVALCPLAHASAIAELGSAGWRIERFENVLTRSIGRDETFHAAPEFIEIREARTHEERLAWGEAVAYGFSAPEAPTAPMRKLGRIAAERAGSVKLLGYVGGHVAGTAELGVDGETAWLSADTTLPEFRGRGLQQALQRHRLERARQAGCTLAVSESAPGGPSQRNMERLGFRVAYTRANLIGPAPGKTR